ncbi:MAG: hypothetical protein IAG13_39210, partial [Deltaproteobacteria bacterium]|nr:hypothetical protein [Nannocystaceae bacterium]
GSAEAAVLRQEARTEQRDQNTVGSGARGASYVKQTEGDAAFAGVAADPTLTPVASEPAAPADVGPALPEPSIDPAALQRRYDLERIAKRGRSYFIPGVVLTTLGTICLVSGLITLAKYQTAGLGGFIGASAAVSAVGWPLLIMGVRLRKHPERYLDKVRGSASIAPTGFTLRF